MKEVSVGIITRNGTVLACQRKPDAQYPLKWEFPGGKVEPGESPRDALIRELHEELLIHAAVDREFHCQDWTYDDATFRVHYYLISSFDGTPANKAFQDTRWVEPEALLVMDILEGNRVAIEKLVAHTSERGK